MPCSTCRYFAPDDQPETGECHRYPPVVNFTLDNPAEGSEFPAVVQTDWCGEYAEKPEP